MGLFLSRPGFQWKPLQNSGNLSGNQCLATITFDNRLAAWFALVSRKRVRTKRANLGANLRPVRVGECVPMARTSLRTNPVNSVSGTDFAHFRRRERCARNTSQQAPAGIGRFHGGVSRVWHPDGCDRPREVTHDVHCARSSPGYPYRISFNPWILVWIPAGFDPL